MDLTKIVLTNVVDWDRLLPKHFESLFSLFISGIEVTQAIQYLDSAEHLTDPADRGPDNGVRLVAGKPAWVRVHVGSIMGASGLTGELTVQRRQMGFFWRTIATLGPDPSSATAVPALAGTTYAERRGDVARTVNFVVPAAEMIGTLRFTARIEAGRRSAESSVEVPVTLRQRLRLAGVMIAYDGPASMAADAPDLTIAAPTLTDLQTMAGTALTLFPVESTADFRTAGAITLTTHLQQTTFPTSGCGPNWDALHGQVVTARTADGNRPGWIYYGLLPTGVPMGPVGGCGGGGVAVGPINRPGTLAHEAGHACGLRHAPAGGAPNPDASYPVYEPYAAASIGEFGLDVNNGAVASPQLFRDFMAYGGPAWIGLYHYGRLLDNDRLNPATVGVDTWWWKDHVWEEVRTWPPIPEPDPPFDLPPFHDEMPELPMFPPTVPEDVVSVVVKVDRGQVVDVVHVARVRAHTGLRDAAATPFTVQLRDEQGQALAGAPLRRLRTSACGCGDGGGDGHGHGEPVPTSYLAQAFLADVAPGASIDITADDEVVWRREAPGAPPEVLGGGAEVDEQSGQVHVGWEASGDVVEYWLRWSADGERWRSVTTGLAERRAELPVEALPPGEGVLQVVAHDGFFSTYGEPFAVHVPERAGSLVVLHPVDGRTYLAGHTVRLLASLAGAEVPADEAVWSVDGKDVARGLDTWVVLEPGEHAVGVRAAGAEAGVRVIAERRPEG